MASKPEDLNIFFFPLMAPGHIIPMISLAKLFSMYGVKPTILATPKCPSLLSQHINQTNQPIHNIDLLVLPSPSKSVTSQDTKENLDSPEMSSRFSTAMENLRDSLDQTLKEYQPSCLISDMYLPWTQEVASNNNIPRLVFHTMGFFSLCVIDVLGHHETNGCLSLEQNNKLRVLGLPDVLEMNKSQLHDSVFTRNIFSELMETITESELKSHGAIVNTFYELEPAYANHYRNKMGRKAWHVGPLCLYSLIPPNDLDLHERIMTWLDSKPINSVLYICFGSLSHPTKSQLEEISIGLERSNHHFIWVMRRFEEGDLQENESLIEQGKGIVINGWAPQANILSHNSISGFMSHCGWNSVLESISMGVPMLTWPMFAEQFYNESLVVDLLGVGVKIGVQQWGMKEEEKETVMREEVERGVRRLMDVGEERERIRERMNLLMKKAMRSVEMGGSSCVEMERLIQAIRAWERPVVKLGSMLLGTSTGLESKK